MNDFLKSLLEGASGEALATAPDLPVEAIVVPGKEALEQRRKRLGTPGLAPVIMGAPEDLGILADLLEDEGPSPHEIVERALALDVAAWLEKRAAEDEEHYMPEAAEWPAGEAGPGTLGLHLDSLTRRPKERVVIGLFPIDNAWEAPAWVRYGGWNECPGPEVHVAIHRRWHARYGSRIACLSGDVIECEVERPPATREEALALAREQFHYCPDIVHQGVESVEALAATLLGNPVWYFWWD